MDHVNLLEGGVHQLDGSIGKRIKLFGGHIGVPHVLLCQSGEDDVDDNNDSDQQSRQNRCGTAVAEFAAVKKASFIHMGLPRFPQFQRRLS